MREPSRKHDHRATPEMVRWRHIGCYRCASINCTDKHIPRATTMPDEMHRAICHFLPWNHHQTNWHGPLRFETSLRTYRTLDAKLCHTISDNYFQCTINHSVTQSDNEMHYWFKFVQIRVRSRKSAYFASCECRHGVKCGSTCNQTARVTREAPVVWFVFVCDKPTLSQSD